MVRSSVQERGVDRLDHRRDAAAEWWGLAVAVAVTVAIGLLLPWEPDRVAVTITNPTDHLLYITTSTPSDDSSSQVLVVGPRSTATADDVIDRGSQWVLDVRTLSSSAGTVETSRSELVDGSFTIPMWINDDLAAAGVRPDVTDPEPDG